MPCASLTLIKLSNLIKSIGFVVYIYQYGVLLLYYYILFSFIIALWPCPSLIFLNNSSCNLWLTLFRIVWNTNLQFLHELYFTKTKTVCFSKVTLHFHHILHIKTLVTVPRDSHKLRDREDIAYRRRKKARCGGNGLPLSCPWDIIDFRNSILIC